MRNIFLFNFFGGLARGPPGARGPRFIEPPEPPVATPSAVCLITKLKYLSFHTCSRVTTNPLGLSNAELLLLIVAAITSFSQCECRLGHNFTVSTEDNEQLDMALTTDLPILEKSR